MSDETTRLRALLERATQTPWEVTEIRDGRQPEGVEELGVFAPCDVRSYQKPDETWHGALICRGMDGPTRAANAALIVAAVNALPGLLDAAERAERAEARVRELEARLEFADRGLKTLTDAGWELATERDRLRAIIEGRTTPPTIAEARAHSHRARGAFVAMLGEGEAHYRARVVTGLQRFSATPQRWIALDADGRPCAWPTAEVSR